MSLLQFIIIIISFVFLIFAIDAFQRKKFNALHFLVFFVGGALMIVFSMDINLLNKFGKYFGLTRGADLIVYMSIILLVYFYFELLNKITRQSENLTKLVTNDAISQLQDIKQVKQTSDFKDKFMFMVCAYNEEKTVGTIIDEIILAGFSKILLINDGSFDGTKKIVEKKISQYKDKALIILLNHKINRGLGAGFKTGFKFFKTYGDLLNIDWIVTFDADGQMDIKDMQTFIEAIKNGSFDILVGSRFIKGGKATNIPFVRRVVLFGSKIITFIFNKLWVSDPHNGYRVISLEALKKINITSDGMIFASEIIDEIKRNKLKYTEIPVNIIYSQYSLSKGQKNSNAFKILFELIYKKFFYR